MYFDNNTLEILSSEAISYNAERMVSDDLMVATTHSERTAKILAHKQNLSRILNRYQPSVVCCESPFYNRLRPAAFGALTEILASINAAVLEYSPYVSLILYPPSTIKKALGGSAFADKLAVKEQMLARAGIFKLNGPYTLNQLDEHAIDALAACYCYMCDLRKEL